MANYSTLLKTWGDTGSEYPDGYSYIEGEQPVDSWDNFLISNVISDLDSLISTTNKRIESDSGASGNEPTSPEASHFYHDTSNERVEYWDSTAGRWKGLLTTDGDTMAGILDMGGYQITDGTGTLTLDGVVNASGTLNYGGNEVLTTALEGDTNGLNADTVDGFHADELGVDFEDSGTVIVSSGTAANFTGNLSVTDDGDGTVTIDDSHNHDGRYARLYDGVQAPVYATLSDVPSGISKGEMVFNDNDNTLYVEDGT